MVHRLPSLPPPVPCAISTVARAPHRAAVTVLRTSAAVLLVALATAVPAAAECPLSFVDRTKELGVDFVHRSGAVGEAHLPETMGAGAAWVDVDRDGWPDLYLVQSGEFPPVGGEGAGDRLYRNLGPGVDGRFSFEDVTARWRIDEPGYGQGVLAIDVDGDRDQDLLLSHFGVEILLENRGGRFVRHELPRPAAVARPWGSSWTAADVDGDGDLDLYLARYLDYDPQADLFCGEPATDTEPARRSTCDPSLFDGQRDTFWRNDGGVGPGGFDVATPDVGLELAPGEIVGKGLGALFVDVDGDHRPDLYVANDITPNHLFANSGDGFLDESLLSGTAVNAEGTAEAGMGLAVVDDDRDGDPDLLVTNFDVETNTLYRNLGGLFFEDRSTESGFGLPSFNRLGFGILAEDFDLDGAVDVLVANGHIFERPERTNVAYRQPDLLLRGTADRFLEEPCATEGLPARVSRGAAAADWDRDGDVDVVVTHVDEPPAVLETVAPRRPWIGVELEGAPPNTDAVGAVVTLTAGGDRQRRWVTAGGSYLSSSSRQIRFAVPATAGLRLEVRWPSGRRSTLASPPLGRVLRLVEERS